MFSEIDMKNSSCHVEAHPDNKEKTAFCISGLWQFNVMPSGLDNAPATIGRVMETVLRDLIGKMCSVRGVYG